MANKSLFVSSSIDPLLFFSISYNSSKNILIWQLVKIPMEIGSNTPHSILLGFG